MGLGRRLALTVLTMVALALVCLPVALTLVFKWYRTTVLANITGKGSGIYIILVVFYVLWMPLVTAGLMIAFDRLGYRYELRERERRPARRQRRRTVAGARFLASRPTLGQGPAAREHGEDGDDEGPLSPGERSREQGRE